MAWLGDRLNSLTSHLSNLTTEVLHEGREEADDPLAELQIAHQKLREFSQVNASLKKEIERLQSCCSEWEERCHANELQLSNLTSEYRSAVKQKEDEIKELQHNLHQLELHGNASIFPPCSTASSSAADEASGGLTLDGAASKASQHRDYAGYHGDEADFTDLVHCQREINRLSAELRQLHKEKQQRSTVGVESIISNNEAGKLKELEKEFQEFRDSHYHEVAALQSNHSHQISKLQKFYESEIAKLKDKLRAYEEGEPNDQINDPGTGHLKEDENQEKKDEDKKVPHELDTSTEMEELKREREVLEASLLELDQQNQEAMSKMLLIKEQLVEEVANLKSQLGKANEENDLLKTEVETLKEQLSDLIIPKSNSTFSDETEDTSFKSILNAVNEISSDNVELEERYSQLEQQNKNLSIDLSSLEHEKTTLEEKLETLEEECEMGRVQKADIQLQLEAALAKISALEAGCKDKDGLKTDEEKSQEINEKEQEQTDKALLELQEAYEKIRSDYFVAEKTIQSQSIEISENQSRCKVLQEENSRLSSSVNELRNDLDSLNKIKEDYFSLEAKLKNTLIDVESESFRILELEKALRSKENTVEELLGKNEILQNCLKNLQEERESVATDLQKKQVEVDESKTIIKRSEQIISQKDAEISILNMKVEALMKMSENRRLDSALNQEISNLKCEKERMLMIMNEKTREISSLKAEVHHLMTCLTAERQACAKLQQENQELFKKKQTEDESMTKETVQNLSRIIRDKDLEHEALQQKNNSLIELLRQSSPESLQLQTLLEERESLAKQVGAFQFDQEHILSSLSQKQQETLNYHKELEKLNTLLTEATCKYNTLKLQYSSVSQQFEEKHKSLINTQNEVISLKQRVSELERQHQENKQDENLSETVKEKETLMSAKDGIIHELSEDISKKEENIKSLEKQIKNLTQELGELNERFQLKEEEVESLQTQIQNSQMEASTLKSMNERLMVTLHEKEFEMSAMEEKVGTLTKMVQEGANEKESEDIKKLLSESSTMQMKAQDFQKERDEAMLALSQRQQENRQLHAEIKKLQDREKRLESELDRLRKHLIEVEESYTKEAVAAEERELELRGRIAQLEDQAYVSSSAVQNAHQSASKQVESLKQQFSIVVNERDKALQMVSRLEDEIQQLKASLSNLHLVLDQFNRDKEREIHMVKTSCEAKKKEAENKYSKLILEIQNKEQQLSETTDALEAAARLSEQLDAKEEVISMLKTEITKYSSELEKARQEIHDIRCNTEGKVDKQIMKSLVVGYFNAPQDQRSEVVRLLARVLDFNREETEKVGLIFNREQSSGWLTGFFRKTQSSPARDSRTQSFSALFVQFLEEESRPKKEVRLPMDIMTQPASNSKKKKKEDLLAPLLLSAQVSTPVTSNVTINRNPLYTKIDHPLMQPISTALPTFAPVLNNISDSNSQTTFLKEALK